MQKALLLKLERYVRLVPLQIQAIAGEQLNLRPQPEKWSKKEILGHLIDSGLYNLQRFSTILFSPPPYIIQPYPQKELVTANAYQEQSIEDLTELWQSLNRQILHLWKNYSLEQLTLEVQNPVQNNGGNLEWWMNDYLEHLEHHLRQILGSIDSLAQPVNWQISLADARQKLADEQGQTFVTLLEHGSMMVEFYQPKEVDLQEAHRQDELYVIASGQGVFYNNGHRKAFATGDVLFVPAGVDHRFENFSADFSTWVIFYGPNGGEHSVSPPFETSQTIEGQVYTLSTDDQKLDFEMIRQYLSRSYWANERSEAAIKKSLLHSLNFGVYRDQQQIGLARIITDFATFAYLADVFILEDFQGKNLGKWLMQNIVEMQELQGVKNWLLFTNDAHGLYEQYGFQTTTRVGKIMERGNG